MKTKPTNELKWRCEHIASTLALQCSTNWALKTHMLGTDQFIEFIFTRDRNEMWNEWFELREYRWNRDVIIAVCNRNLYKTLHAVILFAAYFKLWTSWTVRALWHFALSVRYFAIPFYYLSSGRLRQVKNNFKLVALRGRFHLPVADPDLALTERAQGRGG